MEYNLWKPIGKEIPDNKNCGNCYYGIRYNKHYKNIEIDHETREIKKNNDKLKYIGCRFNPKEYLYPNKYIVRFTCSGKRICISPKTALKMFNLSKEMKTKILNTRTAKEKLK